ncbi:MAG: PAS domain S-box protein [Bacteroidota bacterium]
MSKRVNEEIIKLRNELARAERKIISLEHELGKLNRITEMVKDLVILTDDKGTIRQASHALNPTLGYHIHDLIGTNIIDLIHPGDKLAFDIFLKKPNLKKTSTLLHRIQTQTRKYVWIETTCQKGVKKEADLVFYLRDLSEIKENQRRLSETIYQLQKTEEKFDSFIEQSPDGIVLTDEKGIITNWNKSMEVFSGLGRNQAIGKQWFEVQLKISNSNLIENKRYSEDKSLIENFINKDHVADNNLKFQSTLDLPGRKILHLENLIFKINVKGKNRYGLISRDITQAKNNHDQVLLYKDIFYKNEDGIAILNNDGSYRELNPAYQKIVGYGINELNGRDSSVILGKKLYNEVFKVFQFQNIFDGELRATTLDKRKIYLDYLLFPVQSGEESLCIIQIIRDITERKKAEANLIEAKRRAENADKLKTAFLSNMSHEIRTPMNSILGFSTLLENPDLTEKQRLKYLEFINKNGENLLNLIGDIIDIAKIESNQLKIKKASCNLNYLVTELRESLEKVKELEGKKDVELRLTYEKDRIISIYSDCYRLRQVLVNLIYNAIKFTHQGYIDFGYTIHEEREVIFHVKDTGIGVPEKMKDKIFERFHKNETTVKKSYGGAGLGLAISSQLVKLLGGKIWMESVVGKGTNFYFSLPYIETKEKKIEKKSGEYTSMELNWKSKKILLVEDDSFSAELIIEYLSSTGITIVYADDGRKAVDLFSDNPDIDLIIMDIRLPELNGIEATLEIRKKNPEIPVIAQTAFAMEDDRIMAKTAGFNEFLVKPLNKADFLKTLAKYLGTSSNP